MGQSPAKVLLIRDRSSANDVLSLLQADSAFLPVSVKSLERAVKLLVREQFDVVLLAGEMGATEVRQIREVQPNLPVLVIGNLGNDIAIEGILRAGAIDCLSGHTLESTSLRRAIHYAAARHAGQTRIPGRDQNSWRQFHLMQALFKVVTHKNLSPEQQIDIILRAGCEILDESTGIVGRITDHTYTVEHVYASDSDIKPGQTLDLSETYCSVTLGTNGPLAVDAVREPRWKKHMCYRRLGLNSYIGVPLIANNELFGTLNFSSRQPRQFRFRTSDLYFINMLAEWMSSVLLQARNIEQLRNLATQDALTGIYNRKAFIDKLEAVTRLANTTGDYNFALLFIDLNDFKQINDSHGHLVGDALLKEVALRLESRLRPNDTIGRYAGDEFVILLGDIKNEDVMQTAERILESFKSGFLINGKHIEAYASVGICIGEGYDNASALIHDADQAMYAAKNTVKKICLASHQQEFAEQLYKTS